MVHIYSLHRWSSKKQSPALGFLHYCCFLHPHSHTLRHLRQEIRCHSSRCWRTPPDPLPFSQPAIQYSCRWCYCFHFMGQSSKSYLGTEKTFKNNPYAVFSHSMILCNRLSQGDSCSFVGKCYPPVVCISSSLILFYCYCWDCNTCFAH